MKPRVIISCINSMAETETAIQFGAAAIGLALEMQSGPEVISEV